MIMSNMIPLKEKLDFQQYQLVINALAKIGIEIAPPGSVSASSVGEPAAVVGENEQLFKIQLPLAEPLFLTDKRGGEMLVVTRQTYDKLLLRVEELEVENKSLKDRLEHMAHQAVATPTPPSGPTMAFTTTPPPPVAAAPVAPPVVTPPPASTYAPVATAAPTPSYTSSTVTPQPSTTPHSLSDSAPLVPHTITHTSDYQQESSYKQTPAPQSTYSSTTTSVPHTSTTTSTTSSSSSTSTLHQSSSAANLSNEEALERARRIIEKYKK